MLSLYIVPFVLAYVFFTGTPVIYCLMFLAMGLGMAGIGMNVAHDANHGSTSRSPIVNRLLGASLYLIGVDKTIWQKEHNVEHHTYTNIEGLDTDISVPLILRFSPHQKLRWIHRLQYIYSWFLYSLVTLRWATIGDFTRHWKTYREGSAQELWGGLLKITAWKVFYHALHWGIPVFVMGVSPLVALFAMLSLHFTAGTILGIIFQTAHIMPGSAFPTPDDADQIDAHWAIHQMETTCNYALNSRIFSWFVGGLNYQIEHHLFPRISHLHYPKISHIVRKTAKEYGITYRTYGSFWDALVAHGRYLKQLGREA
ncbi:MAG: acyl-CoA desaturase [Bacteroidota bacterium]